jgi:hypothetical protein
MDNEPTLTISKCGGKRWRLPNGKLHRVDGPAAEWADGTKYWCLNGVWHREDGPAYENVNGEKEWYLNGSWYSFDKWLNVNNYISEEEKLMLKLIYG